jgi:AraC family transcriptional regulator
MPAQSPQLGGGWWGRYETRMQRVLSHVYEHLDEPLDLMTLADIAGVSPYHWHRIFQAMNGESLAATVKRLRLHRAAGRLAQSSDSITTVAKEAGYPNVQSFTRIFKGSYGMPPAAYRAGGGHTQFVSRLEPEHGPDHRVEICDLPRRQLFAVSHQGSYMQIGRAFDQLYARLAAQGLARPGMRSIALFHDDPSVVNDESLRSHACAEGCAEGCAEACADGWSDRPVEAPLMLLDIPSGPFAVLSHTGPYASMKAAYQWLFGHWLVQSGRDPAHAPVMEEYLNSPRDTSPRDLRTHICLPLMPVAASH